MASVQSRQRLLAGLMTPERVRAHLLPREDWRPFPTGRDHAGWEVVPAEVRARAIGRAEARLGMARPGLPDTAYPVIDLFAAGTGALLAWTHYLLGTELEEELPVVADRLVREVRDRILVPYRVIDDWWWLGKRADRPVNNWNPWIHS